MDSKLNFMDYEHEWMLPLVMARKFNEKNPLLVCQFDAFSESEYPLDYQYHYYIDDDYHFNEENQPWYLPYLSQLKKHLDVTFEYQYACGFHKNYYQVYEITNKEAYDELWQRQSDNHHVCNFVVSGDCDLQQLKEYLLSSYQDLEPLDSLWQYEQQYGGGADEHYGIFTSKDKVRINWMKSHLEKDDVERFSYTRAFPIKEQSLAEIEKIIGDDFCFYVVFSHPIEGFWSVKSLEDYYQMTQKQMFENPEYYQSQTKEYIDYIMSEEAYEEYCEFQIDSLHRDAPLFEFELLDEWQCRNGLHYHLFKIPRDQFSLIFSIFLHNTQFGIYPYNSDVNGLKKMFIDRFHQPIHLVNRIGSWCLVQRQDSAPYSDAVFYINDPMIRYQWLHGDNEFLYKKQQYQTRLKK